MEVKPKTRNTDDFRVFGDQYVYCSNHLTVHKTGWCKDESKYKVALGVSTQEEGIQKCKSLGLKLHQIHN